MRNQAHTTRMSHREEYSPPVVTPLGSVADLTMANMKSPAFDDQGQNLNLGSNNPTLP